MPEGNAAGGKSDGNPAQAAGLTPVPDPTTLTTEAIRRDITALQKLMEMRDERLEEVIEERFRRVDLQFGLIEAHRQEQKSDTKTAVDAALSAQKEAVREQTQASGLAIAKSEAGTSKQLEQLSANFATAISGLTTLITDVKERVGKIESVKVGGTEARAAIYALVGFVISLFVLGGIIAATGAFGK